MHLQTRAAHFVHIQSEARNASAFHARRVLAPTSECGQNAPLGSASAPEVFVLTLSLVLLVCGP